MRLTSLAIFFALCFSASGYAQCGPGTPTFNVDLTGNPSGVWTSPFITRNDNCCGSSNPDRCIKFIITLDPRAVGMMFNVSAGALPPGALYYQINCGPPHVVGQPICLTGPYPVVLTFCKPGNNNNQYQITSIPPATAGTNVVINKGCTSQFHATGFDSTTVTWHSIYPGSSGQYDNYLSCTSGCLNPKVTPVGTPPPYVDYVVCGKPLATCASGTVCDTVRATFHSTLMVNILPAIPTICYGQTSITLTANGSGGTAPYTYLWNNINTSQSINVGAGTYNVMLSDSSGCPPVYSSVTVTSFSVNITANAGPDDTVCVQNPVAVLHGSVTGASGGIWSGGGGTFSPNNTTLSGGTYTPTAGEISKGYADLILITTGNGTCPADTDTVRIYFMGFTGTVATTPANVSCYGGSDGSATVSVTGGIAPYTYFWSTVPAQTTATATGLSAGTYSVTLQNGIGCTQTATVAITQPLLLAISPVITNVSCFGGSNGSVAATVTGGTPGYTYSWSPGGQTSGSATNLTAGTYTLTVTDSKNCKIISSYVITQPPQLGIALSPVNVNCSGGSDGSAHSTITGGTAPYTYNWNPVSATSPDASGLPAGTYTLSVTDAKGCTKSATVSVTQPSPLTITPTSADKTCSYLDNGTATAGVSGGSPGYTYSWQPGGMTTPAISNLAAGTYTLAVKDAHNCQAIAFVTIVQPTPITISFFNQTNVSCFGGNNGGITGNPAGGTPGYTFSWNPGGQTMASISGLAAGSYTLLVTDKNGCQNQNAVIITQPATAVTATLSSTPVSCGGGTDGTLSSTAAGGTPSYSYFWQPGGYTTSSVSNVTAGTYTATVTDMNGCTVSKTVVVTQPPAISLTTGSVNAACAASNGQAFVSPSGGVSPYTYIWNPTGQTTSSASGLFAGSYTVIVKDANGCTAAAVGTVGNNSGPTASVVSTTTVSCYGGNNGSATANATGGTLPYTYSWNTSPPQTTSIATGLPAGNYIITVTDATGCQALANTGQIPQPANLTVSVTTAGAGCFGGGGTASASASGGTAGYTYTWWPGGNTGNSISGLAANTTYTAQVTDANGCIKTTTFVIVQPAPLSATVSPTNVGCYGGNNGSATVNVSGGTPFYFYTWMPSGGNGPTAAGLSAGTYTVTITDANGCTHTASVAITQPSQQLAATSSVSSVSCFGGSNGAATVTPSGGTPAYTYLWSPSGGTGPTASGLSAGNYNIAVTDANGCQTYVSLSILQPTAITGTLSSTPPSCSLPNGSVSSQISGGTGSYSYVWTPGSSTGSGISGVGPGSYTLQVTDAAGCTATFSVSLNGIPGPTVSIASSSDVSCFGGNNGAATAAGSQGTAPYTYFWTPYGGTAPSASSLTAGTYTVRVTDALGCTSTSTVAIRQPSVIAVATSSLTPVSCYGGSNGTAVLSSTGGTPPYTYGWSNGQTTSMATGLTAGTYTVTVLDNHNCSSSISIQINQPSTALSTSITASANPSCYGGTGSATVVPSGGTAPYSYLWSTSPAQTASMATGLGAGSYTVTATDANGCASGKSVTITQPAQIITVAGPNDTICLGKSAVLTAGANGGSGNYYYGWQPSSLITSGTLTVTPTTTTSYIVVAYDKNGCAGVADTVKAVVYSLSPANVQATAYSPICPGQSSVVYVQVSGNPGNLTYVWNYGLGNGPGGYFVSPTQPTTYIVTVTNSCGASVTDSVTVLLTPPPTVHLTSDTNLACAPATFQFLDSSIAGNPGDPIVSWYWNFGDGNFSTLQNPSHTYPQAGLFLVYLTVTTGGGCTNSNASVPLLINTMPSPTANFGTNPSVTPMTTQTINFINQSSGGTKYFWNFGDGSTSTEANPQHHFPTLGFYTVTLITTNQYGCSDTFRLQTKGEGNIIFPNAFTPNPNGPNGGAYHPYDRDNDVFFPFATGIVDFHMMIFNRWGELIFETFDINVGWDGYYRGKLCQQDVYVWKADAKFIDKRTVTLAGDVTLLR